MKQETHTIDAADKILGRLATKIAILLQGKHKPDYQPQKDMGDIVIIKHVDKIKVTGKKAEQKKYIHHSDYMGGLKEIPFKRLFERKPSEILRIAVLGMLPKNKLRAKRIKRLKFE
jgi:large subunit ribosomal protein L13